ncbi:hypothetical protein MAH1_36330 [Sessilibacter sp. MAH1]
MKKLSALLVGLTLTISGQCFAETFQKTDDINLFDLGIGPSTQSGCENTDFSTCPSRP